MHTFCNVICFALWFTGLSYVKTISLGPKHTSLLKLELPLGNLQEVGIYPNNCLGWPMQGDLFQNFSINPIPVVTKNVLCTLKRGSCYHLATALASWSSVFSFFSFGCFGAFGCLNPAVFWSCEPSAGCTWPLWVPSASRTIPTERTLESSLTS